MGMSAPWGEVHALTVVLQVPESKTSRLMEGQQRHITAAGRINPQADGKKEEDGGDWGSWPNMDDGSCHQDKHSRLCQASECSELQVVEKSGKLAATAGIVRALSWQPCSPARSS
jgi:hypothetical protein